MSFRDEVVETIATARREAKQRRRSTLPEDEWWQEIRDEEIRPALEDAVTAAGETGIGARVQNQNGGKSGLALLAGAPELARTLTFTHAPNGLQVSSSERGLDDLWTDRDHVTGEAVRAKVLEFFGLIAGDFPEPGPTVMIGRGVSRR